MTFKKVLITGAGGDLGAALCKKFAEHGADIVAVNRSVEPVEKLEAELAGKVGFNAYFVDQSDLDSLEAVTCQILEDHDDIDLVIMNAGIDQPQRIEDFDWRLAKRHFDVNVVSNYVLLAQLVPYFLRRDSVERNRGHLALVSSLAAYFGFPFEHAYNGSKAAVRMMIDGVRAELSDRNIAVTGIYPGFLEGRMASGNAWQVDTVVPLQEAAETIYTGIVQGALEIQFPQEQVAQIEQAQSLPLEIRQAMFLEMMS